MFSFPLPLATAQSLRSVYMDWFVSEWVAGNPRSAMIPAGTWINYHYLGRVEWDKRGRRFCERKGIRVRQRHAGDPRRVITIHLKITYHNSFFLKILSYFIDFSEPLSNKVVTQNTNEISTCPSLHTYIQLTGEWRKGEELTPSISSMWVGHGDILLEVQNEKRDVKYTCPLGSQNLR